MEYHSLTPYCAISGPEKKEAGFEVREPATEQEANLLKLREQKNTFATLRHYGNTKDGGWQRGSTESSLKNASTDTTDYVAYVAKDPVNQRELSCLKRTPGDLGMGIFEKAFMRTVEGGPGWEVKDRNSPDQGENGRQEKPREQDWRWGCGWRGGEGGRPGLQVAGLVRTSAWGQSVYLSAVASCLETDRHRCIACEEVRTDSQAEEREDHQYYNEIPGKQPPVGGVSDVRIRVQATEQMAYCPIRCEKLCYLYYASVGDARRFILYGIGMITTFFQPVKRVESWIGSRSSTWHKELLEGILAGMQGICPVQTEDSHLCKTAPSNDCRCSPLGDQGCATYVLL
ncbi:hypothetical protein P7K49_017542 [Saguinus oedipus]|uniref:Uncharacterized protein n=1 Tax=Saguinus oedipus TaxID=9490 RepID=A0ABQ9V3I0_SAGOE|nr:hypothetical protein P7K49_017542 [Saguinus oedipus]